MVEWLLVGLETISLLLYHLRLIVLTFKLLIYIKCLIIFSHHCLSKVILLKHFTWCILMLDFETDNFCRFDNLIFLSNLYLLNVSCIFTIYFRYMRLFVKRITGLTYRFIRNWNLAIWHILALANGLFDYYYVLGIWNVFIVVADGQICKHLLMDGRGTAMLLIYNKYRIYISKFRNYIFH